MHRISRKRLRKMSTMFERDMVALLDSHRFRAIHTGGTGDGGKDLAVFLFGKWEYGQCKMKTTEGFDPLYARLDELERCLGRARFVLFQGRYGQTGDGQRRPLILMYADDMIENWKYQRDNPVKVTDWP